MGRASLPSIHAALSALERAGFENVNVDFILGLPHVQSGETLSGIRELHQRYPNIAHTSVYLLEYEHSYPRRWQALSQSREGQMAEYGQIRDFLVSERGFVHYEISNFAQPGYESSHNQAYWTHETVLGF